MLEELRMEVSRADMLEECEVGNHKRSRFVWQ